MLLILRQLFCCCCSSSANDSALDERARLLQFQIPVTPSQPILPKELEYRRRMETIVRATEGKMVNLTSRLPFNLHNRVLHDSPGSYSRSNSLDYGDDYFERDDGSYYDFHNIHQSRRRRRPRTDDNYTYNFFDAPRSSSPSPGRLRAASNERQVEGPAAALNIRLVGVSEAERGRTRERSAKPTGLGGGAAASSTAHASSQPVEGEYPDPISEAMRQFKLTLLDPDSMILASWND